MWEEGEDSGDRVDKDLGAFESKGPPSDAVFDYFECHFPPTVVEDAVSTSILFRSITPTLLIFFSSSPRVPLNSFMRVTTR